MKNIWTIRKKGLREVANKLIDDYYSKSEKADGGLMILVVKKWI